MPTISRLTLAAALLGTLAAPAMAITAPVPPATVAPQHHVLRSPPRIHHIAATSADTVRTTPAVTSVKPGDTMTDAKPGTLHTPSTSATVTTPAVTTPAPRVSATQTPAPAMVVKPN